MNAHPSGRTRVHLKRPIPNEFIVSESGERSQAQENNKKPYDAQSRHFYSSEFANQYVHLKTPNYF
jgi:hypothetical protein